MTDPLAPVQAALTTAAQAVAAQRAADQQTIAAQATQIAQLEAELHPTPAARFPGDPGPGRIVVGAIVSGTAGTADTFEAANHVKLGAHRAYYNKGIGDLAPDGPARTFIAAEHNAGRIPIVSIKLDWTQTTTGAYDAALADFRAWCETLPKAVILIANHEPENDGQPPALYCAEQRHIRGVLGRGLKRLALYGSLMGYDWATASGRTPDQWFPGAAADGQPTWDACGIDQYAQQAGNPIDDAKFEAALVSLKAWGVPPALTELGIRAADPGAPAKLTALFEKAVALGFVLLCWYDSDANSTGAGWVLTGPLLTAFCALLTDPRAAHPNA